MLLHLSRSVIANWRARQRRSARKIALIERALGNLPTAQRHAYRLSCVDHMAVNDAAMLLGISRYEFEQDLASALVALACALDES